MQSAPLNQYSQQNKKAIFYLVYLAFCQRSRAMLLDLIIFGNTSQ